MIQGAIIKGGTLNVNNNAVIDSNGKLTAKQAEIDGEFKTGGTGARIEITQDGLKTYNNINQLNGLVVEKSSNNQFADINIYWNNNKLFTIYNNADGSISLKVYNDSFLTSRGESTTMEGIWKYKDSEVANKNDLNNVVPKFG